MSPEELLLHEYKVCHDGYISRDTIIPTEFAQMVRTFLILIGFNSALRLLMATNVEFATFLYFVTSIIGFCCFLAYAINIESKNSSKGALRGRMVAIETRVRASDGTQLEHWKAILERPKSSVEKFFDTPPGNANPATNNLSRWFVRAAWLIFLVWIVLAVVVYFAKIEVPLLR